MFIEFGEKSLGKGDMNDAKKALTKIKNILTTHKKQIPTIIKPFVSMSSNNG
jgi:hypothetical protein